MNSISSKFTALAAALLITSVTMGTLGISSKFSHTRNCP
jgi:hypothetical protein